MCTYVACILFILIISTCSVLKNNAADFSSMQLSNKIVKV
jgi:hypothetical protein